MDHVSHFSPPRLDIMKLRFRKVPQYHMPFSERYDLTHVDTLFVGYIYGVCIYNYIRNEMNIKYISIKQHLFASAKWWYLETTPRFFHHHCLQCLAPYLSNPSLFWLPNSCRCSLSLRLLRPVKHTWKDPWDERDTIYLTHTFWLDFNFCVGFLMPW